MQVSARCIIAQDFKSGRIIFGAIFILTNLCIFNYFTISASGMVEEIMKVMETNGQLQGKYLQILFTDRLRHLHLKGTIITNQIVINFLLRGHG